MTEGEGEDKQFDQLDKDFVKQIKLIKECVKLYLKKENNSKKIINSPKWFSNKTEADKNYYLHENQELIDVLDKILKLSNFEEQIINMLVYDEKSKNVMISEVKEIMEVDYNLRYIKKRLFELRGAIQAENNYFKSVFSDILGSKDAIRTAEFNNMLLREMDIFGDINRYYIQVFRRIRDYIKNLLEKKPLISVIIPAFNEEKYVQRCLNSVVRQTYPNKEIIVVDNMSTDNTVRLIAPYTYRVASQNIRGISMAKNKGAEVARGDILVFFDADSMMESNLLKGIYFAFLDGYNCGKVVDIRGDKGGIKAWILTRSWYYNDLMNRVFKSKSYGAGACLFCDKKLFFQLNGFNAGLEAGEDVNLTAEMIKHGKFKHLLSTYYYTSMRRFEQRGYVLCQLEDNLRMFFPKLQREWTRD